MKVTVSTRVEFSMVGNVGAVLFIAAPLVTTFLVWQMTDAFSRSSRYLPGATLNFGALFTICAIGTAVTSLGLAMMLVGREYVHVVRSGDDVPEGR